MPLLERESAEPSGSPAFTLDFSELHIVPALVFYEVFCRRLFCLFFILLLAIVLSAPFLITIWYFQALFTM